MRPIDADSLKSVVDSRVYHNHNGFIKIIDEQPTINAVSYVHAHWILDPNGMDWNLPAWVCSKCHNKNDMIPPYIKMGDGRTVIPKNPNAFSGSQYCPYCGAKMDEVGE